MTTRVDRKGKSIREVAKGTGYARSTIIKYTSRSREEYLAKVAREREEIRRYHDDLGHSWTETAARFDLSVSTVQQRARRARREREAEEAEKMQPPLFGVPA